jgi:histidine triad (HIT) family protein
LIMLPFSVKKLFFYAYKKGIMKMFGCVFCQVAAHEKPSKIVYEDEHCVAIRDINPKAPVHLLVIPRKHISSLNEDLESDEKLLGHLLSVVGRVAKQQGVDATGYRTVINTNAEAGQTVFHLHIHVLGGRILRWPPG